MGCMGKTDRSSRQAYIHKSQRYLNRHIVRTLLVSYGWITVGGAGMVNPIVLKNCGYNPEEWNGFAFGFGVERLAMLKYGVSDIRTFYMNHDVRTLRQFDRREY